MARKGGVFRVAPGKGFQLLLDFAGWAGSDTESPIASALVESPDGFLLGTGYSGGLYREGTIFALTPDP